MRAPLDGFAKNSGAVIRTLAFESLTPSLGAEVIGLDPADISAADAAALLAAFHRYHVLVIRKTPLTEEQQVALGSCFGRVRMASTPSPLRSRPEIMVISNIRADGVALGSLPDGEMDWHYDGLHQPNPYLAGVLHAIEVPARGGDTRFANMCKVYEELPLATRAKLDGLTAFNIYDYAATDRSAKVRDEQAPRAVHPVVRAHDATGERALFICRLMTERIPELPEAESTALLEELFAAIEATTHVYEHRWSVGDTLIWDNQCVTHGRNDFSAGERRYLKRVTAVR
jgi:alpha-ketoglutarate-dependent taurine dioxygenase